MASDRRPTLAEYVRRLRLRAGLTQEELAERAGLTPNTVGALERGLRGRLFPHTARALADALGLDDAERAELAALARGSRPGQLAPPDEAPSPAGPPDSPASTLVPAAAGPVLAGGTAPSEANATAATALSPQHAALALPAAPTSFVGRERELTAAVLLLAGGTRLLTLTGPGGTGKTRLALAVALRVRDSYADGVQVVDLAAVSDPGLVASALARTLGVRTGDNRPIAHVLGDALHDRRQLIVLDNFEQVVAAAPLVTELLRTCPELTVLVTSRVALRVAGEQEYPVQPLPVPDTASLADLDGLAAVPAVALFVQRVAAIVPDFTLTEANAATVAAICVRLDGLPLALELAAARARVLTPQMLLARLDRRLPLLTGGARDLPARQQTLRDTIAWSYQLLSAAEQALFRRLAVFVGGCTLPGAESVCDADGGLGLDVLDGLESLCGQSLLRQYDGVDGEPRFTMLETVREYGLEQLVAVGEEAAVRRAHADYFAGLAEASDLHGPLRGVLTRQLEADQANLHAAVNYCRATPKSGESLLRLTAALGYFWFLQGHAHEARAWCEAALASPEAAEHPTLRARVLFSAGHLAWDQGDLAAARPLLEAGAAGARETGDSRWLARALFVLGEVLLDLGERHAARAVTEESAACARTAGHSWELGLALQRLGMQAFQSGELPAARAYYEESLTQFQRVDDPSPAAYVVRNLGYVAQAEGRYAEAFRHMTASITTNREIDDLRGVAGGLAALAGLAVALGQPAAAVRLSGAMAVTLEQAGATAVHPRDRVLHERALAEARAALDAESFERALAEGRTLTLDDAVALAEDCLDQPAADSTGNLVNLDAR